MPINHRNENKQSDAHEELEHQEGQLDDLADAWLAGRREETATPSALSVSELLHRLVTAADTIVGKDLLALSDLSLADMEQVRREWPAIPDSRRRAVIRYLVDLAGAQLDVHLSRLLRIALNDSNAVVRRLAIQGLWEDADGSLIGPFILMLRNDPDAGVRVAAARALGDYMLAGELEELDAALAMRVEDALLSAIINEDEAMAVRCRALESVAFSSEAGVRQLIEDAYYDPDEDLRVSALTAMGRSADVRWRGLARAELQNPTAAMRAAAAYACGELMASAALNDLIELVSDDEQEVRSAAIIALGQIGGKTAREVLEAIRLGDEPADVEAADLALEEMMFFSDEDGMPSLLEEDTGLDDLDLEPWERGYDFDDDDLGTYE